MTEHFNLIREIYFKAREHEWKKLRQYLRAQGLNVITSGHSGYGYEEYSPRKKLIPSYDLTNWRWVEVKSEKGTVFISFQPFDRDSNSNNNHALFDRIGVSWYTGKYNAKNLHDKMMITDIELPLNDEKMKKIHKIIGYLFDNIKTENLKWKDVSKDIDK